MTDKITARGSWAILGVLVLAQFMIVLDATVVNIALPSAQEALRFSDADRQWIVTTYSLVFGSLLLPAGRLTDLLGRRTALIIGLIGFAVASAVGGTAPSFGVLTAARGVQGAFGALLAPAVLSLLSTTFTAGRPRALAFAVFGAVAGAGGALGLLLGGFLTEYFSWRWCLYVNLPLAFAAVAAAIPLIPRRSGERTSTRMDPAGMVAVVAGLVGVVYGLGRAESAGWTDGLTLTSLIGGAAALAAFVLIESRVAAPLLPLRVLADRNRAGAYAGLALANAGLFAVFLFLTFYLEQSLHLSPVRTGLAFVPMIVILVLTTTLLGARLVIRFGPRPLMSSGLVIAAAGLLVLARLDVGSRYATGVLPGLLILGVGLGLAFAPGQNTATGGVPASDAGSASALTAVSAQTGASIGTALLSTIAAGASRDYLTLHARDLPGAIVHSYTSVFVAAAVIFGIGAIVTGALLRSGPLGQAAVQQRPRAAVPERAADREPQEPGGQAPIALRPPSHRDEHHPAERVEVRGP
ncbi:MFS transporter [Paractinoplanes maris]|uniref:MFS transporter n=1 Tax=Paractinoplanes maris TaxID=1734446 RepID=UPI0020204427|nr:MFS transporter [Actinoplanes maris]